MNVTTINNIVKWAKILIPTIIGGLAVTFTLDPSMDKNLGLNQGKIKKPSKDVKDIEDDEIAEDEIIDFSEAVEEEY